MQHFFLTSPWLSFSLFPGVLLLPVVGSLLADFCSDGLNEMNFLFLSDLPTILWISRSKKRLELFSFVLLSAFFSLSVCKSVISLSVRQCVCTEMQFPLILLFAALYGLFIAVLSWLLIFIYNACSYEVGMRMQWAYKCNTHLLLAH